MATYFYVEITDMYGGEANFAWVKRYKVEATTPRGAIRKINKETGSNFRRDMDLGETYRYISPSRTMCAFVSWWSIFWDEKPSNVKQI